VNRIDRAFERARAENRALLVPFVTCGDPDLATTAELIPELEHAGADIVEIGFPHSDPFGEGPVIQAASLRALQHGASLARALDVVKQVRAVSQVPLVLMGYLNNVLSFGTRVLPAAAVGHGVDGLIVVDAPYDEVPELQEECDAHGLHRVLLVAPTSTPERVVRTASRSRGFIYCVSVAGVTGERGALPTELRAFVERIQRVSSTPVAVGFGIGTPEQAAEVARFADAVVVGSALVRRIAEAPSGPAAIKSATAFVRELAAAVRGARS
jgi:tryptophan synthase alpha chain